MMTMRRRRSLPGVQRLQARRDLEQASPRQLAGHRPPPFAPRSHGLRLARLHEGEVDGARSRRRRSRPAGPDRAHEAVGAGVERPGRHAVGGPPTPGTPIGGIRPIPARRAEHPLGGTGSSLHEAFDLAVERVAVRRGRPRRCRDPGDQQSPDRRDRGQGHPVRPGFAGVSWPEREADAAHRLQNPRLALGLELAPQVADEDVDDVAVDLEVVAPDQLEQPLADERPAGRCGPATSSRSNSRRVSSRSRPPRLAVRRGAGRRAASADGERPGGSAPRGGAAGPAGAPPAPPPRTA